MNKYKHKTNRKQIIRQRRKYSINKNNTLTNINLSQDTKNIIKKVYLQNSNITSKSISEHFDISEKTVFNILKNTENNKKQTRKKRKMTPDIENFIIQNIDNVINTKMMSVLIKNKFDIYISDRTIAKILKDNNFVYKRVSKLHKVSVEEKKQFYKKIENIPKEKLMALDETGFSTGQLQRRFKWCQKNEMPTMDNFKVCNNISSMAIIGYNEGLLCHKEIEVSYNRDEMLLFLKENIEKIKGKEFLILDNVRFHHTKIVIDYLKEINITPIFITRYSPEQNPIEYIFSIVKRYLRESMMCKDVKKMIELIMISYELIEIETVKKCFDKSLIFSLLQNNWDCNN